MGFLIVKKKLAYFSSLEILFTVGIVHAAVTVHGNVAIGGIVHAVVTVHGYCSSRKHCSPVTVVVKKSRFITGVTVAVEKIFGFYFF